MTFKLAFDRFMEISFESSCDSSTLAARRHDAGTAVELFSDGTYQVLWSGNIGNLYDSHGMLLNIPAMSDGDWDKRYYGNAREFMEDIFTEHLRREGNLQPRP